MTNSGKRRRSEKRAQEQLKSLCDARLMLTDNIATTRFGGPEYQRSNVTLSQIDEDIRNVKEKLLLIR